MVRMIGAVLVAAGAAWLGFRAAQALGDQVRALTEADRGLELLEQELELGAPPLEQVMDHLIPRTCGPARALFAGCRQALDRLEEERFAAAWRRLVEDQELLGSEGKACLRPLGDSLGQCGCTEQRQAIRTARLRLGRAIDEAREERRRTGRVYQALGLSGGAFLVILLL